MAIMTRCSMPAGQLGRDLVEHVLRLVQAHRGEQLDGALVSGPPGQAQLHPQHLRQLVAHGHRRVQVGGRVLEHGTHVAAVHVLPAAPGQGGQVVPGERHRPVVDGDAGGQHAERGPAGQRLAAAGLPHQPDDLPGPDAQRDAADRGGRPVVHADVQVVQAQQSAESGPDPRRGCTPGAARRDQAT